MSTFRAPPTFPLPGRRKPITMLGLYAAFTIAWILDWRTSRTLPRNTGRSSATFEGSRYEPNSQEKFTNSSTRENTWKIPTISPWVFGIEQFEVLEISQEMFERSKTMPTLSFFTLTSFRDCSAHTIYRCKIFTVIGNFDCVNNF